MNEGDLARLSFRMIEYFRGDQRRVHHALKVHGFARQIALAGIFRFSSKRIFSLICTKMT